MLDLNKYVIMIVFT